jgi:hypothetical protein
MGREIVTAEEGYRTSDNMVHCITGFGGTSPLGATSGEGSGEVENPIALMT